MRVHLTPTALAKAKALSIVAAAVSAGSVGGVVALSQVADTSSTAVTVADATSSPTPTDSPTASPTNSSTATPTDSPSAADAVVPAVSPTSTAYVLPSCPADVKNHGAYVSSVAHSAPKGKGGVHGSWVSQAAHSDCGKPSPDASASPDPTDASQSPDSTDTESPKPAKTTQHHVSGKHGGHEHGGHSHGG